MFCPAGTQDAAIERPTVARIVDVEIDGHLGIN